MGAGEWDALEVFFAEKLYAEGLNASDAVVQTCNAHPRASVQNLVLALTSAASALKLEWKTDTHRDLVKLLDLHDAIIGLTIDLAALELIGKAAGNCGDLLKHWNAESDPLFRVY